MVIRKKKSLGQHFLHDQSIIDQIIALINPQSTEHIIEIGPGAGALTTSLLPLTDSLNVIELDQDIIPVLRKNCNYSPKLQIENADVLRVDFTKFGHPMRIVGNLPYNISTPILFGLIKTISLIKDMHFMLQKEVADRILAIPGSKIYGRLSVMVQYHCEPALLLHVGAGAFSPPPKVASAFIRLTPRTHYPVKALDTARFGAIVHDAFCQRRKTIANSLKKHISSSRLEQIGIDPIMRAEQLSVDQFITISNEIMTLKQLDS